MWWSVPENLWKSDDVFIIGGGPSLKGFDVSRLRDRGRVIAINNAGTILAPWADVLYWSDSAWLDWNRDKMVNHHGAFKVTRKRPHFDTGFDVKVLQYRPNYFSTRPDTIGGWCSGSCALNLACLFGTGPKFLLGFDMQPTGNWHNEHKDEPSKLGVYKNHFIPVFDAWAPILRQHGQFVFNCNRRSELKCFPFVDIDDVLA